MQRPTAEPRIPASARGVSTQRSGPKRSRSPAVARKTPPARPTSSPITRMESSRSISVWSASFTASTSVLLGIGVPGDQLGVRLRKGFGGCDARPHRLERLAPRRFSDLVGEDPDPAQVALEAAETLVPALRLHSLRVDVRARIVGSRVGGAPVRDRFDERRALARAGALDGLTRRLVDRQDVPAVDPDAGHPVADGLVR